jgi:hypothetical protein
MMTKLILRFKEFLLETPYPMNDKNVSRDTHTFRDNDSGINLWRWNKPMSTMPSGHQIFCKGIRVRSYSAFNPKTKKVDMHVNGFEKNGILKVNELRGRKGASIKAHEFYHHLITHPNHNLTLHSSDIQTKGGRETWRILQQHSDIEMQHMGPGILGGLFRGRLTLHTGDKWGNNYRPEYENSRFVARKKE